MLFSQPGLAAFLSNTFECAWESVRPVPRLTVDFGDGRVLERTLRGNVAPYVCTSDGRAIDLVPGLMDAREYERRLRESLELFERLGAARAKRRAPRDGPARRIVSRWHGQHAVTSLPPEPAMEPEIPQVFAAGRPELLVEGTLEHSAEIPPVIAVGRSKFRVEGALERSLAAASAPDESGLALDTRFAREQGRRQAHAFLAARPLQPPSALTRDVYRELLHVDLDDPYLGLAPNVLGGEAGRH